MAYGCYTSADLCAVRISVLNDDGTRIGSNPNGSAYTMDPISLAFSSVVSTGEVVEQRNGCGDLCFSRRTADQTTGQTLTLTLCKLDPEFISLATGAAVLLDGSAEVIGFDQGISAPPAVELHAWTKAYDVGSQVASPRSYVHHVWPYVKFTLGDGTLELNNWQVVLSGTATPNGNLGSGSFGDLPASGISGFYANFLEDDIPDPDTSPYDQNGLSCGFIDTPALLS
jgi:hypothetical protein